jgi:hypothetical protein
VHLLKCIRNNWIIQVDQTYRYLDNATAVSGVLRKASFAHLQQLYHSEQLAAGKMAPGSTYTALNPNNLQRRKVNLALKFLTKRTLWANLSNMTSANGKLYFHYSSDVENLQC